MKQRLLVTSIAMGLCANFVACNVFAQQGSEQQSAGNPYEKKKEATNLESIVVTGSLIPRAQIETASPTLTITAEDMKVKGYTNVYDALRSLPTATGGVQDNQSTNSATPAATTISLLGLDPSFTLVLMNGRPMADYPLLYNGASNFVDLTSIPNSIVDHIDILPGNQSAIYGSSAVAGVINIVTKQNINGVDIDFRTGGYTEGGGAQQRLQISGGHTFGKFDLIGAIQLDNRNPIYGSQRDYTNDVYDNPTLSPAARAVPRSNADRAMLDAETNKLVGATPELCAKISNLAHGTMEYTVRPGSGPGSGPLCGSPISRGYTTFLNGFKSLSAYGMAKYQLNDSTQFYADLVGSTSKQRLTVGGTSAWTIGDGTAPFVYDLDSGHLVKLTQHLFMPEELNGQADKFSWSQSYIFDVGLRGSIGDSNWNYDAYYHRSDYLSGERQRAPLRTIVNAFFLGPQDGMDPKYGAYPAYHIERTGKFWGAVTPDEYRSISDTVRSDSSTYSQVANITVTNTDVLTLPAGPVGAAGILEVGNQSWDNPVDPRVTSGEFWGVGGTSGQGDRDRWAGAVELTVPVFKMLTADVSGRYDKYSTDSGTQGKLTYKLGLEFRPLETLLLRGNVGTAFRAPDMGYLFSKDAIGFDNVTDYYNCRKTQGDQYKECPAPYDSVQIHSLRTGNEQLKYITAKSFGYGLVWSPTTNLQLKADFVHVKINNEVNSYSVDAILEQEADCRIGHTRGGTPIDGNSQRCQQLIGLVKRTPLSDPVSPGGLINVTTYPINISNESVSNIIADASYKLEAGRLGDFVFFGDYNIQKEHLKQQFPGDPSIDYVHLREAGNQFNTRMDLGFTWHIDNLSSTLQWQRYGKTWSADGSHQIGPWEKVNASTTYHFGDAASLSLIANNLFDKRPPYDNSYGGYPYYDTLSYDSYGRMVMLEMTVHFGGRK
jgi:outer membrane receptor protein involved in Fe transport